ncbi:hypothetical protein [Nocardioides sp.]|uniref:hypothetical protein n=1 Tax=Nocardioides sp. TaxID=35761 RepID=UPI00286BF8F5|nr:hypothetical protein [Nocardioides sp.]
MHDDPHDRYASDPDWHDRLRHLVLVDGRLVATWTEPIEGTRWEVHAHRFDREAERRAAPPAPPQPPPYERALLWLEDACGGRAAVLALDTAPLDDREEMPEAHDPADRERLAQTLEHLDGVAATVLSDALGPARADELGTALRRALALVWSARPDVVRRPRSPQHLAGTLCWVVGKANGVFGHQGPVRMKDVREALELGAQLGTDHAVVEAALWGLRPRHGAWFRPSGLPELLLTGRADLLVSDVRAHLVRVRDQALEAQAAHAA